jgi:4-diphosphocytidyl-2-C-methyl-D-erythritol kinase
VSSGEAGRVELVAPAKLTLSLRVTGVRPDGYHLLRSEMVTLDLADTLVVDDGSPLSVELDADGPAPGWEAASVPLGSDNLVARALVTVGRTARVRITKRIPPGAGLGGGSADAAAILRWAGCHDRAVAAGLGADVPFCLTGGRAMVGGVGESVAPLPHEDREFTLLLVPFGVDTGAVYRAWDRLVAPGRRSSAGEGSNDLEAAALSVESRLIAWKDRLRALTGQSPRLAGSGSTWFVEGRPEESGVRDRQSLQVGNETGVLVSVSTTPSTDAPGSVRATGPGPTG